MERDAAVAPERPVSPEPDQQNLLQSACVSLAASQAGQPAANSDSEPMERRERDSPAATAPDGPLPGAAPQNESSDADIFYEYDLESGAAGSASGGAAGGADTGCAMTSPAGGSRDPSPVPPPAATAATAATAAADAAAEPSKGDGQLARSEAVPVPGGGRTGGDHVRSAERPVPVLNGRRRGGAGGSLGQRTQQSPSEKVDAWLRSCHDDSGGSAEEDETGEKGAAPAAAPEAAPKAAPDEPQFVLDGGAGALEDSSDNDEMMDALAVDDRHDLRGLMARGLQLLHLDAELDPLTDRQRALLRDEEQEELEGAVGGCEDLVCALGACSPAPKEQDCMRPQHQRPASGGSVEGGPEGAEDGVEVEAAGVVVGTAYADADDEAGSTSGGSSSFAPPDQLKRSSSLKSGKTPPHTPGRKKFVRFADAMGLDLQHVHTFRDEIPTVPAAAFRCLRMDDERLPSPPMPTATFQMSFGSAALPGDGVPIRHLVPMFLQPVGSVGFLDRLRRDKVVLESVTCNNDAFTVNGVVRVLNMDFHKAASVRYTLDEWRTSLEVQAEYIAGSCDGLSDRFRFTLHAGSLMAGERLHFVLRFDCLGQQFWDNNGGENYTVQMLRSTSASPSPVDDPGDWSGGRL